MTTNNNPCGQCENFDVVVRGTRPTKWGWCAKKSVYPLREGPGQSFPKGVTRVDTAEEPARPFLVQKDQLVPSCLTFVPLRAKPKKEDLLKQLQSKGGKVILK